jgi:hypothetical protein
MAYGSQLRLIAAAALALVVGCVPRTPAPPPPAPAPLPRPTLAAPAPVDWQDWPRTPGTWFYERDARGSRALFGRASADALAVLRCDRAERRVTLSRTGAGASALSVRTTALTRTLPASAATGATPMVMAALAATDPLLDAMAFTRGRLTLEIRGAAPLVLPPYAEVSRVVEDCRG